jgi:hypothetical protein
MKIKEGFLLRSIAQEIVVVPVSGDLDLNMMIKLNETGRFLWEQLQSETTVDEVVQAVLRKYNIEEAAARNYVEAFVKDLEKHGFLC